MRLFHCWANFPFTTSERYIRVTLRDAKRLKTCGKYQNITEFLPSAHSPHRSENPASTRKNLLRNRYWTLPAVRYFTRKLEFVSNNLWLNSEYTLKLIRTISSAQKNIFLFANGHCRFITSLPSRAVLLHLVEYSKK